ncbi:hypothetical protein ASF84_09675 [Pseudomonas sp. Leaf127]|uniref:DUF7716 domain-containing protein n=1 Tax=Pseudomonas sp. Leaf127 TaxID=1736267 RepID=UPI000702F818|nr:hypothetical protein [Pseudomonas sp. Leaf127]KQQ55600.1 hypothetical protein ASF84_09675 [Pseudomonas sp. Leaf127]
MFKLNSFRETVEAFAACSDDQALWRRYAWVYVQGDTALLDSRFYLGSNLDEDDERRVSDFGARYGLSSCLEAATFADVLSVQKRQQPHSSLEDYASALEHYVEQDAFMEVPGADNPKAAEPGLARELYAEYDLFLAECAPDQLSVAAREVSAVLGINIASALQGCRALPLCLGTRMTGDQCRQIEGRFSERSIPLQRVVHRSFPWQ